MRPFYWQGTKNFGDYMNSWLWPELLKGMLSPDDGTRLIGIGSLLKSSLNYLEGKKVVFGTGSGYGSIPSPQDYKDWYFYFVRGPLTAKYFNLPPNKAIVDGAWLISQVEGYQSIPSKKGIAFVPHWTTSQIGNWQAICDIAGIKFIDPLGDLQQVLYEISTAELIIAESLHGAIMADYFRTPWIPVSISPKFLSLKWADWFQSVEIDGAISHLPLSDTFEYLYCGRSRKNIDYDFSMKKICYEDPVVERSQHQPLDANAFYRLKIALKSKARSARGDVLEKCMSFRDNFAVRSWDSQHKIRVARGLLSLSTNRSFLSSDVIREVKIHQLGEVLYRLKQDYNDGKHGFHQ